MALLEKLIVGVGQGVAKGILWLALEDEAIARETGLGIFDILGRKTDDLLAKRQGQRQFEQIAEKVAQNLDHFLEVEAKDIPEDSQQAIVLAAGEAISDTPFPAEVLLERNLEPSRLEALFRNGHRARGRRDPARHFSDSEAELYRRILSEASQYIVDSASQMPSFRERSIAELLGRQDLILDRTTQILEETRRLREAQSTEEESAARFATEYRRAVVRKLDWLELFGVDVRRGSRRYRLNVAYVGLEVEQEQHQGSDRSQEWEGLGPPLGEPEAPSRSPDFEEDEDVGLREVVPIAEALATRDRLFVRGPAGSGKTTLLQWVAVQTARRTMDGDLEAWNAKIPFFVRLRELAERALPTPEDLVALVSPAIAGSQPTDWARKHLETGDAVLLIDGLDEIAADRRDEVKRWLDDLLGVFGKASFVLSARPHAAEEGWLDDLGFSEADLRDMGRREIETFVDHWHRAVAEEVDASEQGSLQEAAVHLKKAVFGNRPLQLLATSPLLCALLCALHYDRQQDLPKDRIDLYNACFDMFLRRDRERRITMPDYPDVGDRQKRALLEDLAYYLIKNGWSEIDEERADERLERKLDQLDGNPEGLEGQDLRRLFVERTGILRQPTLHKIDFPHRTFQEFLAAKAALHEGDLGLLVERAHEVQWREVLLLAVGLARKKEAEEIVEGILLRGDRRKRHRQTLYLLGAACLDAALDWAPEISESVDKRLLQIIPPENMTAARALAAAGDLVVPHLAFAPSRKATELAACVRTLTLVGTPQALSQLDPYQGSSLETVHKGFASSLQYAASPEAYAVRFLVRDNRLAVDTRVLDLSELLKIEGTSELRELSLSLGSEAYDLGMLKTLSKLRRLRLEEPAKADLTPLGAIPDLRTLEINRSKDRSGQVLGLGQLRNLEELLVLQCDDVELSPLGRLEKLRHLDLSRTSICDLRPLMRLQNLKSLILRGTRVSDLIPLSQLKSLQNLDLSLCPELQSIQPLAGLVKLRYLRLGPTPLKDLSPLFKLDALRFLDLGGSSLDPWLLKSLRKLKVLAAHRPLPIVPLFSSRLELVSSNHFPGILRPWI